jgi:hypothetical protein
VEFDSHRARRRPVAVGGMFRILSALMAALFMLAVVVQFNDPDPARWMLVYGSAAVLTALIALDRRVPVWAAATLALVAFIWGLRLAAIYGGVVPGELFQQWEMKDERIEIAREAGGLLLVAGWMGIVIAEFALHRHTHTASQARS